MPTLDSLRSELCRYCEKPIAQEDLAQTTAYWRVPSTSKQPKFPSHADCKVAGQKKEAFDCQLIDADCNDCKHFIRGENDGANCWRGQCSKLNKPTLARPNSCMMYPCFEHRLA